MNQPTQLAFLIAAISVCLGYALAVYLGRRSPLEDYDDAGEAGRTGKRKFGGFDGKQALDFLRRLHALAGTVDSDMDRHSTRVAEISSLLEEYTGDDATAVLGAAAQLIDANKQLQQDLTKAKEEVEIQRRQLDSYMTEARTDALTGLANRRAFDQELNRRFAQWRDHGIPLSVALVDVDHFKDFNDQHGHQVGDDVLSEVARLLSKAVRGFDLVARYGGEEFGVVLPGTRLNDAKPLAERMRAALADHAFHVDGAELQVTASIGVAEAQAGGNVEHLIKRADAGLYAAKEAGRNCVFINNGRTCEQIEKDVPDNLNRVLSQPHRIAPFVDGRFPEPDVFTEVLFQDISSTGFSYVLDEKPDYELVLLVWGTGSGRTYMTASVEYCANVGTSREPSFLVVCRFTARVNIQACEAEDALETVVSCSDASAQT
jgi:diguanylate cyclase (GGDEF)-like protein